MPRFELISNHLCPYTQRAVIQLHEKGLDHDRIYIDLAAKPAWLLEVSPLGKVPVLRHGDAILFESQAICEYIEEIAPARPLLPTDPLARAGQRAWMEFASAATADVFGFYTAPDATTFGRKCADLAARFRALDMRLTAGPYFDGEHFGLADAAFAPLLRLFDSFDAIADFGIFTGLERVPAYRRRLAQRPSVQRAVVTDYSERFRQYLLSRGSPLSGLMD
jgi:glutathione S-transferase